MLQLFDTAAGRVRPVELREPGKVSMYVCGPTVYGPPHLGHGRFSLVFDVLRRYLAWTGLEVTYVSNITDIDDKIINTANAEGVGWQQVVDRNEAVWWAAMDAIEVLRPDEVPHATAYVDQMVALTQELLDAGGAYATSDGIYFSADQVGDYGLLARQSIESLRAGARVEANEEKRNPVDFALWKFTKPGEPSWPAPFGDGRPGWHTECVVMSLDLLGERFDIHGGGQDLAFPHHENERAQAVAVGKTFAHHWVHNGFVEVDGEKMSKSLGNFTTLVDLIERHDPRAYRLLVLQAHYRAPIEVTGDTIDRAVRTLEGLDGFARRFASQVRGDAEGSEPGPATSAPGDVTSDPELTVTPGPELAVTPDLELTVTPGPELAVTPDPEVLARFRERMDDDLDTPGAMALLFEAERRANRDGDLAAAAAVFAIAEAVGLSLRGEAGEVDEAALALAARRDEARGAKDWAEADRLRDELVAAGYEVADTPQGTQLRPREQPPTTI